MIEEYRLKSSAILNRQVMQLEERRWPFCEGVVEFTAHLGVCWCLTCAFLFAHLIYMGARYKACKRGKNIAQQLVYLF